MQTDTNSTNKVLDELRQIQSMKYTEPKLEDYYKSSDEKKGISIFNNRCDWYLQWLFTF